MTVENWRPRRLLIVWLICLPVAVLLMVAGTVLDAGGRAGLGFLMFLVASISIVVPVVLSWHRWRDRERR